MSVAITAQVPVESFATPSPASASPRAGQGTGATTEQGLVDFFAKARLDAGNGQTAEPINSVASGGDMLGKLREFIDKAHQVDAKNHATRVKQRAAAAQASIDLATLDTLGSLSQFRSLGQSGSRPGAARRLSWSWWTYCRAHTRSDGLLSSRSN